MKVFIRDPFMRRHLIGIIAVGFLLLGLITTLWPSGGAGQQWYESMGWRLGAVMALWWLAYPEASKLPVWTWFVLPIAFLLLLTKGATKWVLLALLVAMVVVTMLGPRPRRSAPRPDEIRGRR
jgi:hypothetical protein